MNRQFVPTAARIRVCAPRARDMVPERSRDAGAAGVDCLRLGPHGKTVADQIAHPEMSIDLVNRATAS